MSRDTIVHHRVYDGNTPVVKEEITETVVLVINEDRPLPAGFRGSFSWAPILNGALDRVMYPAIGRRENIRPNTTTVREYRVYSRRRGAEPIVITDRYIRIGKQFVCCRLCFGRERNEEYTIPMQLSEDQKESIAAAAMHPSRLEKWLAKGWEEEWNDYFG